MNIDLLLKLDKNGINDVDTLMADDKEIISFLDDALFNFYKIKKDYNNYYIDYNIEKERVNVIVNAYKEMNQIINQIYDELTQDPHFKYFGQVDPNNQIIIEIGDEIVKGITDEKEIAWKLWDFVRKNVEYKHDPNWMTDWIFPPPLTLLAGCGDCDDMSVLLASLMLREGVTGVKLCFADTNNDGAEDHLTVEVGDILYEPTCSSCGSYTAPEDVENWKLRCYDPQKYSIHIKS